MSWQRGPHPARPCPKYAGFQERHLPVAYRLHGGCTRCPAGGPCEQEQARAREVEADEARRCVECGHVSRCSPEPEHRYRPRGADAPIADQAPAGGIGTGVPLIERLWANVDRADDSACWLWKGNIGVRGYGTIKVNYRTKLAHRVSYELIKGPIPDGLLVCHRCDNPPCVNPSHLFLGTHADNVHDRNAKGRAGKRETCRRLSTAVLAEIKRLHEAGESNRSIGRLLGMSPATVKGAVARGFTPYRRPARELTDEVVAEIRRSPEPGHVIAKRLGLPSYTVSRIRLGQTYAGVQGKDERTTA